MNVHVSKILRLSSGLRHRSCLGLVYKEHGVPEEVVKLEEVPIKDHLNSKEVEVAMLAVPVNPSDINQIQGTYPIKPQFPAVGGNEGVGRVVAAGSDVSNLQEGDLVIPCTAGLGTWRAKVIESCEKFIRINSNVPMNFAATVQVNPPTAYRMLKDFVELAPGDVIIQNGSNSAVGQCVIQLAAAWGLRTINVIRSRPSQEEQDKLTQYLLSLGATEVVSEEFAATHKMKEMMKLYPQPRLALNCVGGKSSANIIKHLAEHATAVTYGGMSRQPVTIPTGIFIFKQITCTGYWNADWLRRNLTADRKHLIEEMVEDLCDLAIVGKLRAPLCEETSVSNYKHSLSVAMKPFSSVKQVLFFP